MPSGTTIVAASPFNLATRATARPWLPSVAVTRVWPGSYGGSPSSRRTAQEAPRNLNAGSPKRSRSNFSRTDATSHSRASSGASISGVGSYPGRAR